MKNILALFALLFFVVAPFSHADAASQIRLYNAAATNTEQLVILQTISNQNPSGIGEFYAAALSRLVQAHSGISEPTQLHAADAQAMILARHIANEGLTTAASDLWRVADQFTDPVVRSEAMIALGRLQARTYLPHVIRVLNDHNQSFAADRLYSERIAYGAIVALEHFADPSGFLPVYFASVGWYSNWVRSRAVRALPLIAEDSSPFMEQILTSPAHSPHVKLTALENVNSSNLPNYRKAALAATALSEAWRVVTADVNKRNTFRQIRRLSMAMISRYGAADSSVYPLLARCYTHAMDTNEKEDAVNTLASLGTDEAVRILSGFLTQLNDRSKVGMLTREDNHMVRLIIPALGSIGNANALPALYNTIVSNWVPVVTNLAHDAVRRIAQAN